MIDDEGSIDSRELDEGSAQRASSRRTTRAITILTGIVATVLVGWVLRQGADILKPIVIALLLCSVLSPVVRLLRRFGIPSAVTVLALLVALVMGLQQGADLLWGQYNTLTKDGGGWEGLEAKFLTKVQEEWKVPEDVVDALRISTAGDDATPERRPVKSGLKEQLIGLGYTLTDFIRGLFLVAIYMIFIFAEAAVFRRKIVAVAEERDRGEEAERVIDSITFGIQRYLGVKTVTSLATGVACYTVMQLLGLQYAALFGVLTYLLNYIPTFGSFAAAVPPIATAIATTDGARDPLIVAGTYLVANVVIGGILDPRMLGRELNLSPLVVLVSVVVWAAMWGVPGMFLAVPLTATIQIVLANIESTRPVAMLLSNGPPVARRRKRRRGGEAPSTDDVGQAA